MEDVLSNSEEVSYMSFVSDVDVLEEIIKILKRDVSCKKYNIRIFEDPQLPEDVPFVSAELGEKVYELARITGATGNYNTFLPVEILCFEASLESPWEAMKLVQPMLKNVIDALNANRKLNDKALSSRVVNVVYDRDKYNDAFYVIGRVVLEVQNVE